MPDHEMLDPRTAEYIARKQRSPLNGLKLGLVLTYALMWAYILNETTGYVQALAVAMLVTVPFGLVLFWLGKRWSR